MEKEDPRKVGETWHSHYWDDNYTVLQINGEWLRVRWESDGSTTDHCTPLDSRDTLVTPL